jgi:hypothetical protein
MLDPTPTAGGRVAEAEGRARDAEHSATLAIGEGKIDAGRWCRRMAANYWALARDLQESKDA